MGDAQLGRTNHWDRIKEGAVGSVVGRSPRRQDQSYNVVDKYTLTEL